MTGRAILLAMSLALAPVAAAPAPAPSAPDAPPTQAAAIDRCLYIPPALAERVVFYLSFDGDTVQPEINALGGQFSAPASAGDAAAPGSPGARPAGVA
ncbi:MAG: hypothetical protein IMZ66_07185, partial [Planctomycetes bacterium]|nr:hypothetical protein [Planctomycetota bacterium]